MKQPIRKIREGNGKLQANTNSDLMDRPSWNFGHVDRLKKIKCVLRTRMLDRGIQEFVRSRSTPLLGVSREKEKRGLRGLWRVAN